MYNVLMTAVEHPIKDTLDKVLDSFREAVQFVVGLQKVKTAFGTTVFFGLR